MVLSMTQTMAACSSSKPAESTSESKEYASATELLGAIWKQIPDDESWDTVGGLGDKLTDSYPGEFDLNLPEDIRTNFNVPDALIEASQSGAGLMDMMMANYFTASAWILKSGSDVETLSKDCEKTLKETQWLCGMPEKYSILSSGNNLVVVYGLKDKVDRFEEAAKKELPGVKITSGTFE